MKSLTPRVRQHTRARRAPDPDDVFRRFMRTLERLRVIARGAGPLPQAQPTRDNS